MNEANALYKDALLDHYRNPRGHRKEPFDERYITARGRNPRCGDDVELGLSLREGKLVDAGFRGRGCSICMASTSMLVTAIADSSRDEMEELYQNLCDWRDQQSELPESLAPLEAVRSSPARQKCALLGWNALGDILESLKRS
ncbi:MAG: SUF system NifU family Fe-S cluster assembly protein [Oceanospirillaceae bacterium]|nr:SUF system NifU family Fe-S cluster assembly protein [Oceanospirillaceae bacterium]